MSSYDFDCAVTGLFEGVRMINTTSSPSSDVPLPQDMKWLLRILPQNAETRPYTVSSNRIPTVYGAVLDDNGTLVGYVRGEHTPEGGLVLFENFIAKPDTVRRYAITQLTVDAEIGVARLKARSLDNGSETVVAQCDTNTTGSMVSVNLYVGVATPDPELAAFMIPTNPIEWLTVELRSTSAAANDQIKILGAVGYFISGDVAGQPTLLYSIEQQDENGANDSDNLVLKKVYEPTAQTEGWEVVYKGKLVTLNGRRGIVGTWDNEKGQTKGFFACAAQPLSLTDVPAPLICADLRTQFPVGCIMLQREGSGEIVSFDAMPDGMDEAVVQACQDAKDSNVLMMPFTMASLCPNKKEDTTNDTEEEVESKL